MLAWDMQTGELLPNGFADLLSNPHLHDAKTSVE
jgi:hypothetical protein